MSLLGAKLFVFMLSHLLSSLLYNTTHFDLAKFQTIITIISSGTCQCAGFNLLVTTSQVIHIGIVISIIMSNRWLLGLSQIPLRAKYR